MTSGPIAIDIDDPPSVICEVLGRHPFHHLPVLQHGLLVGVVSAIDLARISLGVWVQDKDTAAAWLDATFTVADVMTCEPDIIRANDPIKQAADELSSGAYHCLPVLDEKDQLVGMLTSTDLVRWIVSM
jgi:CBS domain-containing protein